MTESKTPNFYIRDLHRINSHIVSAGYPIVEAAGLLRGSRLRNEAKKT